MAKTLFEIRMDYLKALREAAVLEKIAENVINCTKQIAEQKLYLSNAWEGENSRAFNLKVDSQAQAIKKNAERVYKIAETVRRIAKRTYETEKKAIEISRKRTYNG